MGSSSSSQYYTNPDDIVLQYNSKKITAPSSRRDEVSFVSVTDKEPFQPGDQCYIMSAKWLDKWYQFVQDTETKQGSGIPNPGVIDNDGLVDFKTGKIKPEFKIRTDFRPVHKAVWEYLFKLYGGTMAVYFIVPSGFDDIMYAKGSWSRHIDFYALQLFIIHVTPQPLPSIHRHLKRIPMLDLPKISVRVMSTPLVASFAEISVVSADIIPDATDSRKLKVFYSLNIIPPRDVTPASSSWTLKRSYQEFETFDQVLRKANRNSSAAVKLTVPSFPSRAKDPTISQSWLLKQKVAETKIESRRKSLDSYLFQLVAQPGAWQSREVQIFFNPRVKLFDVQSLEPPTATKKAQEPVKANPSPIPATPSTAPIAMVQPTSPPITEKGNDLKKIEESQSSTNSIQSDISTPSIISTPPTKRVSLVPKQDPLPLPPVQTSSAASQHNTESVVNPMQNQTADSGRMADTQSIARPPTPVSALASDRHAGEDRTSLDSVDVSDYESKSVGHSYQPKVRGRHRNSTLSSSTSVAAAAHETQTLPTGSSRRASSQASTFSSRSLGQR